MDSLPKMPELSMPVNRVATGLSDALSELSEETLAGDGAGVVGSVGPCCCCGTFCCCCCSYSGEE